MPTRIEFALGDRRYEAVSFLLEGETSVDGKTIVTRADAENDGGLGQEDGEFLWEHRSEFPKELKRYYMVFTKWCIPGHPNNFRDFGWNGGVWVRGWHYLDDLWYDNLLVIRRCM